MKKDNLPKVGQLSKLAVSLYKHQDGIEAVSNSVKLAAAIWSECQDYIDSEAERLKRWWRQDYEPYDQPMKVGNHFMPRVSAEFLAKKHVSKDELLNAVVGMSKSTDRERSFREFAKAIAMHRSDKRLKSMGFHLAGDTDPYGGMSTEQFDVFHEEMMAILDGVKKHEPDVRPSVEAIQESLRKYGTEFHHAILENFREWRIWEAIPVTDDDRYPEIFAQALQKGLEHEKAL